MLCHGWGNKLLRSRLFAAVRVGVQDRDLRLFQDKKLAGRAAIRIVCEQPKHDVDGGHLSARYVFLLNRRRNVARDRGDNMWVAVNEDL